MSFGSRARAAMAAYGPACFGIDPHAALLADWDLPDSVDGLAEFAKITVEAFAGQVAFVKPQSAFFERFGSGGVAVLERTIQDFRHTGTLVILDVKRGDIGSTAAAYADAYLDEDFPMACDAITISPFLGVGSLEPFFEAAEKNDAGVFVLALTSNKEGPEVQHARTAHVGPAGGSDQTVAGTILARLAALNAGQSPMGPYGAVVGATIGGTEEDLAINGPLLVPGLGAQGGTVDDLHRLFGGVIDNVIPSTSRGVLRSGPDAEKLREAAHEVNRSLVMS